MELRKYKLGEIAEIIPGYAFKSSDFGHGKNIAIKIKDIVPPGIDIKNADTVDVHPGERYQLQSGDYVMAMTGATIGKIGKIGNCEKRIFINQRVCKFIANNLCDKEYLYYVLNSDYFQKFVLNNIDSKLAQPNIGHPTLYKFENLYPTLLEQKRIASVLSNIDSKIELNRAINQNLEAMAKQLYDYWFVQFDFPNEEGKPYKSSGGEMVWNEKLRRDIPIGWSCSDIKSALNIFTGKKDVSKAIPGPYKFFSCAPEPISSNEYMYDGEVVLVSGNGSYTGRVGYFNGKFDLYQRTYACVLKSESDTWMPFYYYTLRYMFQPVFSGGKHGSSMPYIVLGDLADFKFAKELTIINRFVSIVAPMFNEQFKRLVETEQLIKQRNELLPLLMNGQVSVNSDLSDD